MTKKITATVPATATAIATAITNAIAADIKANLGANKSGAEVAQSFDKQFPFSWARFKGNASAAKCGMSAAEFKLIRDVRTEYRDAWNAAGLPNFDRRWQYVASLSVHAPKADDAQVAAKTTEAKLEEALRAAYPSRGNNGLRVHATAHCATQRMRTSMAISKQPLRFA
jgi:hypothetical protein